METKEKTWITKTWAVAGIALICSALWGSAFSGVKTGYIQLEIENSDWASQMIFAGLRFFLAGLMALFIGSLMEKKLLLPQKKTIPKIGLISLFQTILQYFFYYIGLAHTTGVKAAIIVAANVFAAILISALLFHQERLTTKKILGCIVGFAGILLINFSGLQGGFSFNLIGDGMIFLCTIASGFSSVIMKKYSAGENPVLLSGWQFCFGGFVLWLFGTLCGGCIEHISTAAIAVLVYLAFVSAAAYSLWATLLKYNPVSKVAVFGFLNPICGVIISGIVLQESNAFGIRGIVSLLLVCAGVFIVNRTEKTHTHKIR